MGGSRMIISAAAVAMATTVTWAAPSGDAGAGKLLFSEQCAICHSTVSTGGGAAAPDLNGIVGRKSGTLPGFAFSRALKDKAAEWTPESLDRFIGGPQVYAPGAAMPVSLEDAKDRADVVSYLASLK